MEKCLQVSENSAPYKLDSDQRILNLVENTRHHAAPIQVASVHADTAGDPLGLVQMAQQIEKADDMIRSRAHAKLSAIVEQVRFLQEQARKVLEECNTDNEIHHIPCNFKKTPGNMYHVYKKENGNKYLSMISPKEWGSSCPHECLGSYNLEKDMTFTPERDINAKKDEMKMIDKILHLSSEQKQSSDLSIQFGVSPN